MKDEEKKKELRLFRVDSTELNNSSVIFRYILSLHHHQYAYRHFKFRYVILKLFFHDVFLDFRSHVLNICSDID